jgi:hypothetical protein
MGHQLYASTITGGRIQIASNIIMSILATHHFVCHSEAVGRRIPETGLFWTRCVAKIHVPWVFTKELSDFSKVSGILHSAMLRSEWHNQILCKI